jgi:hypothetical protein
MFFLSHSRTHCGLVCALAIILFALPAGAGTTGTANLYMPQGGGAPKADGDFVSSNDTSSGTTGLNTAYHFWIEVPQNLHELRVQLYDADTGTTTGRPRSNREDTTGSQGWDRERGTSFDTSVTYTLLNPGGTTAATLTCNAGGCAADNAAWVNLYDTTTTPIPNGHWELRVDTSGSGGDDINGIGVSADDPTDGTELNVYIDSMDSFGVHSGETNQTKTYTVYPWVTAGCTFVENDFDYDTDNGTGNGTGGTYGSMGFTSRDGLITRTIASASLSGNDVWKQNSVAQWGTDNDSTNYGIWSAQVAISTYNNTAGLNGNYSTVWFGNPSATNPPSANPNANSFRTYLPQGSGASVGGAPIKPYLEQMVRYEGTSGTCNGGANGPNPPGVGQTTCYTVTVRLVNPSGAGTGSITFSTSHLVTANVPGGGVTYDGQTPQVSQGSVTAHPPAGGTGNITWNPGAVTAGATPLLAYVVRVTPSSSGQRLPVTGTYASNGTTATYVDQTGNTTQARATITLGPICGLAVTQGTLTEALISSVRAYRENGMVMVEWETASEAGTMGFVLERFDPGTGRYDPVVDGVLPALIEAPQGGRYRLPDPQVSPREVSLRYRIVEVRADGTRLPYGPYDLAVEPQSPAETDASAANVDVSRAQRSLAAGEDYVRAPHAQTAIRRGAIPRTAAMTGVTATKATGSGADSGVRIGVTDSGLYYVSSAALAPLLGDREDDVARLIASGGLTLTRQGRPVAWLPEAPVHGRSSGLFFYGQAVHDLYSAEEVYHLQTGHGTTMSTTRASGAGREPQSTFSDTTHFERDVFPATALDLDPESDYWFWEFLIAGDPTYGANHVTFDAPGVATPAGATLTIHFQGATSTGLADEHHAVVTLNGTIIGDAQWTGITGYDLSVPVSPATLLATGNQLQIQALLGAGVPDSVFYLNSFDLSYPRSFAASGDVLAFTANRRAQISVGGFSGADVTLLDIGNPQSPRQISGASVTGDGGTFRIGFESPASSTYLAVGPRGLETPTLRPWLDANLTSGRNGAQYLIVTTSGLTPAAQQLAGYRQRQRLSSMVIDVEAIMNEFSFGRFDPHAIRDFLVYAKRWWHPAPQYVLLAGAGSADYRNLLGYADCLVPTIMVATPSGIFGADNCLADLSGTECMPDLAIGRVPAVTAQELSAYTAKVIAYEADRGAWAGTLPALADARDHAADFAAESDLLLTHAGPNYAPQRIYLDELPLAQARAALFADIQAGSSFIDYLGHGGMDRLSAGGLLTSGDVAGLHNGSRLPVLTAMTCTVNRFTVPGFRSLGEQLVTQPGGGAAAVWSPSALSIHSEALTLAGKFYDTIQGGRSPRLGDAVLQALGGFEGNGGNQAMLPIYVLLGDPALLWKAAPPSTPASGPPTGTLE